MRITPKQLNLLQKRLLIITYGLKIFLQGNVVIFTFFMELIDRLVQKEGLKIKLNNLQNKGKFPF
ncbi:hypothetical protein CN946_01345 [Bacillus sp. AFS053548]|nr:hypothetical protein CN946_01345 [Bacillus sp. AFS053548]